MPDKKLVMHPVNPRAILHDPSLLLDALRNAGLVGTSFSHEGELHYRAGPRFLDLVTFRASVPPDPAAYHVSLLETTVEPTFLGGQNALAPHCPHCKSRFTEWHRRLPEWQKAPQQYLWTCPGCRRKLDVKELDWGPTGGIARYSVDLWNIGQDEAVPAPALLDLLADETLEMWRYFYYRF
jgi:hypothetical protein